MPERPLVLVTEPIDPLGIARLASQARVALAYERPDQPIAEQIAEADAVVVRVLPLGRELLSRARRLRVIGKHGVGVDNIDLAAATELGIAVVNTPQANAQAVAEMALALLMALARKLRPADLATRAGTVGDRNRFGGVELAGKTLGVVGVGNIGLRLARMCRAAFDMAVLAFDPYADPARLAEQGVRLVDDLGELLAAADYVSVHAPLTEQTRGLIGREALARMKPTAYLVNTARGGIVDELALAQALRAGRLAGAALDVFVEEPPPPSHPLFQLDNLIATPHVAGITAESMVRIAEQVAGDVLAVLRGEQPPTTLNPRVYAGR